MMPDKLIFTDSYAHYIFSSWGLAVLLLVIMLSFPLIHYFRIQKQLAKQHIRLQRINRHRDQL